MLHRCRCQCPRIYFSPCRCCVLCAHMRSFHPSLPPSIRRSIAQVKPWDCSMQMAKIDALPISPRTTFLASFDCVSRNLYRLCWLVSIAREEKISPLSRPWSIVWSRKSRVLQVREKGIKDQSPDSPVVEIWLLIFRSPKSRVEQFMLSRRDRRRSIDTLTKDKLSLTRPWSIVLFWNHSVKESIT